MGFDTRKNKPYQDRFYKRVSEDVHYKLSFTCDELSQEKITQGVLLVDLIIGDHSERMYPDRIYEISSNLNVKIIARNYSPVSVSNFIYVSGTNIGDFSLATAIDSEYTERETNARKLTKYETVYRFESFEE